MLVPANIRGDGANSSHIFRGWSARRPIASWIYRPAPNPSSLSLSIYISILAVVFCFHGIAWPDSWARPLLEWRQRRPIKRRNEATGVDSNRLFEKKTKNKNSLFQERSYARLRLSLSRLFPSFVFLLGFFFRFAFGVEPQLIPCVQMVPTQSLSVAAGEGSWVLCTANTNRVILIDEFTRPVD